MLLKGIAQPNFKVAGIHFLLQEGNTDDPFMYCIHGGTNYIESLSCKVSLPKWFSPLSEMLSTTATTSPQTTAKHCFFSALAR